eukprot:scaffold153678_cov21-Tisochrysis_lutea.AAC.1
MLVSPSTHLRSRNRAPLVNARFLLVWDVEQAADRELFLILLDRLCQRLGISLLDRVPCKENITFPPECVQRSRAINDSQNESLMLPCSLTWPLRHMLCIGLANSKNICHVLPKFPANKIIYTACLYRTDQPQLRMMCYPVHKSMLPHELAPLCLISVLID